MVNAAIKKAYEAAVKRLWDGRCDVLVEKSSIDPATGRTVQKWVPILENEPCRISYSSLSAAAPENEATKAPQTVKLFISIDKEIPEGSRILVTQKGRTECYRRSGKAGAYSTHGEILLELEKEWT